MREKGELFGTHSRTRPSSIDRQATDILPKDYR